MKRLYQTLSVFLTLLLLLTACAKAPETLDVGNGNIAAPNSPSAETTAPTESTTAPDLTVEEYNLWCVRQADGKEVTGHFAIDDHYSLVIDATVDTSAVERVSLYEYIRSSITDDQRVSLLKAYFKDRYDEVYHYTYGNADSWFLKNDTEFYAFGNASRSRMYIDERLFTLTDYKCETLDFDEDMLVSLSQIGFSLDDAYARCTSLTEAIAPQVTYVPDCVCPFNTLSLPVEGVYRIMYRQIVDGMLLTGNRDLLFYVSGSKVFDIAGAVCELEEHPLNKRMISVDEAVECLSKNAALIDCDDPLVSIDDLYSGEILIGTSGEIPISKITLEYLVVDGADYLYTVVPIWRFQIGTTDEERLMSRERIIAINALTGELIAQRRGI